MWPPMPASYLFWRDHHGHGVPADEALDAPFDGAVAGIGHFLLGRDRVDVRRIQVDRQFDAGRGGALVQLLQQVGSAIRSRLIEHLVERFQPFPGFLGVQVDHPLSYFLMHLYLYYNGHHASFAPLHHRVGRCSTATHSIMPTRPASLPLCRRATIYNEDVSSDWTPLRWPSEWTHPSALELVRNSPVNCILLQPGSPLTSEMQKLGVTILDAPACAAVSVVKGDWPGIPVGEGTGRKLGPDRHTPGSIPTAGRCGWRGYGEPGQAGLGRPPNFPKSARCSHPSHTSWPWSMRPCTARAG